MNFHYTNLISSRGIFWLTIACTLLALGSCDEWFDKNDDDDSSDVVNFEGEVFARRLDTPWEMVFAPDGRLRNVVEGSDGRLYLAVSNQDGRGDPRDTDDVIVVMTQDAIAKEIDK